MRVERRSCLAILLIICGALMVFNKFGLGHLFGHLFGLVIPLAMLVLGYLGFQGGRRIIGGGVMVLGAFILFGHLSGLIGLAIAVGLVCYGVSMLKRNGN